MGGLLSPIETPDVSDWALLEDWYGIFVLRSQHILLFLHPSKWRLFFAPVKESFNFFLLSAACSSDLLTWASTRSNKLLKFSFWVPLPDFLIWWSGWGPDGLHFWHPQRWWHCCQARVCALWITGLKGPANCWGTLFSFSHLFAFSHCNSIFTAPCWPVACSFLHSLPCKDMPMRLNHFSFLQEAKPHPPPYILLLLLMCFISSIVCLPQRYVSNAQCTVNQVLPSWEHIAPYSHYYPLHNPPS